ncbi:MAG: hypothetical protein QM708_09315 [Propioniciclava sp.]|uniref:hypothetical protein n=1 Tax=Propioniciclava sp. TaxID=2038686 RepID=UPI0039E53B1E
MVRASKATPNGRQRVRVNPSPGIKVPATAQPRDAGKLPSRTGRRGRPRRWDGSSGSERRAMSAPDE